MNTQTKNFFLKTITDKVLVRVETNYRHGMWINLYMKVEEGVWHVTYVAHERGFSKETVIPEMEFLQGFRANRYPMWNVARVCAMAYMGTEAELRDNKPLVELLRSDDRFQNACKALELKLQVLATSSQYLDAKAKLAMRFSEFLRTEQALWVHEPPAIDMFV